MFTTFKLFNKITNKSHAKGNDRDRLRAHKGGKYIKQQSPV